MIQNLIFTGQAAVAKVVKGKVLLVFARPAMMPARVLAMIGGVVQ